MKAEARGYREQEVYECKNNRYQFGQDTNLGVTFPSNDNSVQNIHNVPVTMIKADRRVVQINFRFKMGSATVVKGMCCKRNIFMFSESVRDRKTRIDTDTKTKLTLPGRLPYNIVVNRLHSQTLSGWSIHDDVDPQNLHGIQRIRQMQKS